MEFIFLVTGEAKAEGEFADVYLVDTAMVVESLLICILVYVVKSRRIQPARWDIFLERSCVDGKIDQLLQSGYKE